MSSAGTHKTFRQFLEEHIDAFLTVGVFFAYLVYSIVWLVCRKVARHDLPWLSPPSLQSFIETVVALPFVWSAWRHSRKAVVESDLRRERDQRKRALDRLQSGWIERVFEPSIYGGRPIAVPLRRVFAAGAHPGIDGLAREVAPRDTVRAHSTSITEAFEDSHRSLLILGAPGSGKTTLLLQLAKALHNKAVRDPAASLPVVLSLATWTRWRGRPAGRAL